ncbi:serine/threonine-protein kinase [Streptomyces profundus]|uniref:serine/threonine-protein kinase n=1 Tax=Streptomyces profundus TaxID=2867410 RepID=UPI001D167706|nr:serine/threonine-protein kinase [Streptomyces sp. MA3_2.13]
MKPEAGSEDRATTRVARAGGAKADGGAGAEREARAGGAKAGGGAGAEREARAGGEKGARPARLLNGRYLLGAVVGRGGMGTVWRATDEVLGRSVAVKELRLSPGVEEAERKRMITRTLREAKAIATIRSRGVVTIYDVVDEGSRPWIVMELIEGRSLADLIRQDGPMSPHRAAEIGLAVLDVLRDAHGAGILHRDVKPSNVIVADDEGRVVLTDFGIAKVEGDPSITSTGMLVGAPSYISPERARGAPPGPPADMWSLGALLYCCVEGRPPYDEGSAIATLAAVMHDPVPPPSQAGELGELIMELLRKRPDERPAEPRVREVFQAVLGGGAGGNGSTTDHLTVVVGKRQEVPGGGKPATAAANAPQEKAGPSAAAPVVSPDADGPRPPARPPSSGSGGGDRNRLALAIGAVVLALAVLGTAVVLWLNSGDDSTNEGGAEGQEQTTEGQQGENDPAPDEGAEGGTTDGADGEGAEGADSEGADAEGAGAPGGGEGDPEGGDDGPPGTAPENDPDARPDGPTGYAEVVDPEFHFRISLPGGWERVGTAGRNSGAIYSSAPGEPFKVQVDFTDSPGDDAEGAWRAAEPSVRGNSTNYEQISIETIDWNDYPTVADWQFERDENGERVRVLNRGFRVDDNRGYAIMITCPADAWDDNTCRTLRDTAFQTFEPMD